MRTELICILIFYFSFLKQNYFDKIVEERQCLGLRIKQDGEFGKCVFAESEFKEGDLVLKDQMLVGAQHSSNKVLYSFIITLGVFLVGLI